MNRLSSFSNSEITSGQLAKLLYLFCMGSAALIVPPAVAAIANQDSWFSMLLIIPVHCLIVYLYLVLHSRFPRLTIAQYTEKIVGIWIGKAITLTFVFFFMVLSSLVLKNVADFLGKAVLPQTPEWFISATFMLVVAYGLCLGLETIARTGEILFGWTLFVIVIITFTLINQMDLKNLEPVFAHGLIVPIKGFYPILGFPLSECIFLTAVLPMIREQDRTTLKKKMGKSVIVTGIVSVLIMILLVSVLGVSETKRSPFAVYEMAKSINIEEVLVRVEILFAMIWIGTIFIKLALSMYSLVVLLAQMLGLRAYRPLVFPLCVLMVPLSLTMYRNSIHATIFAMDVWTVYSALQGLAIPAVLLVLAMAMGKRSDADGRFPENPPPPSERTPS
ncbi:endospore germination permease [Paenibacillus sp. GCM10027627]|uniref:GerAB/ArcD/ProY family transporter n=1 Tax=unclassified Paenibacillus TaxID=185978 RepID=UPI003631CA47